MENDISTKCSIAYVEHGGCHLHAYRDCFDEDDIVYIQIDAGHGRLSADTILSMPGAVWADFTQQAAGIEGRDE